MRRKILIMALCLIVLTPLMGCGTSVDLGMIRGPRWHTVVLTGAEAEKFGPDSRQANPVAPSAQGDSPVVFSRGLQPETRR